jgi:hypothetical protein
MVVVVVVVVLVLVVEVVVVVVPCFLALLWGRWSLGTIEQAHGIFNRLS